MNYLFLSIFVFLLCRCESPMDNRKDETPPLSQKANSLEFKSSEVFIKTQWLVGPVGNVQFDSVLLISVYDEQGVLEDLPPDLHLQFYATMPSMGHPLDDAGTFEKISTGLYLNQTIKYNMSGDWQNELWLMDSNLQIHESAQWSEVF